MWSQARDDDFSATPEPDPGRAKLLFARIKMAEALKVLDEHSLSAAAASLDLALHQLDRELARG